MNGVQAKIITAASAGVEQCKQEYLQAKANMFQAKERYLKCVVDTASATERVIRKKGRMAVLIGVLSALAVGTLVTLIQPVAGIVFFILVITGIILSTRSKEERISNYNARKGFFVKYDAVIPQDEALKWKNVELVTAASQNNGDKKNAAKSKQANATVVSLIKIVIAFFISAAAINILVGTLLVDAIMEYSIPNSFHIKHLFVYDIYSIFEGSILSVVIYWLEQIIPIALIRWVLLPIGGKDKGWLGCMLLSAAVPVSAVVSFIAIASMTRFNLSSVFAILLLILLPVIVFFYAFMRDARAFVRD